MSLKIEIVQPELKTLADLPPKTWAEVRLKGDAGRGKVFVRCRGISGGVYRLNNGWPEVVFHPASSYQVVRILGQLVVGPPEPCEPPPRKTLAELWPWMLARCKVASGSSKMHIRWRDRDDNVYKFGTAGVPEILVGVSPCCYAVVEVIGQFRGTDEVAKEAGDAKARRNP